MVLIDNKSVSHWLLSIVVFSYQTFCVEFKSRERKLVSEEINPTGWQELTEKPKIYKMTHLQNP